eukprot:2867918-Amphidinium_carterae.1
MLPNYGQRPPAPATPPATDATAAGAATATASTESQQQPAGAGPFIKWCLVNVIINQDLLNSMDSESSAAAHSAQYGWYPSKYNRRYVDYSVEIINDPQQQLANINISHFMQIKSIWGSIKDSPLSPTPDVWLASHLIDYSIVSSSVHQ